MIRTVEVRVSGAQARQLFHGCEPDYIRDVCHAACCRSTVEPSGIRVVIHPTEIRRIERRGGIVVEGRLQPVERRCPFNDGTTHLCHLHGSRDKPFGCIASPFTLSSTGRVLIVRNRYRLLRCYNDGNPPLPAYVAFRASLDLIFGPVEAARVCRRLKAGDDQVPAAMSRRSFDVLRANTKI